MVNLEEILGSSDFIVSDEFLSYRKSSSGRAKNNMKNVEFNEFVEKEISTTTPVLIKDVDSEHRMDHIYDLGWMIFNKHFKQIPCEFHLDMTFKVDIIDWARISGPFREQINAEKKIIWFHTQ